jgi:CRISPR system Cascade subunit CasE
MYFTLIKLRKNLLPRDIAGLNGGDGYSFHKLLWNLFSDGPDRRRDFLYRFEAIKGMPTFYTVSERKPVDSGNMWDVHSKPYDPKLQKGDRLSFTVRVNPIRSKRDENGRQQRHDVVMEAKNKVGFKNLPTDQRPHVGTLIQDAGIDWLKARSTENGFSFEDTNVRSDGYFQHKLFKGKNTQPITFSTLDLNGILSIIEPATFVEKCLFQGIGPAKGFGCGLMLVKRI